LCADDVFLANASRQRLPEQTQLWNDHQNLYGLKVNPAKKEYLDSGTQTDDTINIDTKQLKKVTDFKYLCSTISVDGLKWLKWRQVTGVLCDRRMPIRLKAKIYRVVRPVALYGCECWPAAASHERALHAMEMRVLRWSLGLIRLDHVANIDIRTGLKVAPITEKMRQARLRWYGHVMRRDEQSVVRTALNIDPAVRRPRGLPKKRWLDRLNEDMRIVNIEPRPIFVEKSHQCAPCNGAGSTLGRRSSANANANNKGAKRSGAKTINSRLTELTAATKIRSRPLQNSNRKKHIDK